MKLRVTDAAGKKFDQHLVWTGIRTNYLVDDQGLAVFGKYCGMGAHGNPSLPGRDGTQTAVGFALLKGGTTSRARKGATCSRRARA
jgi:hypothetical protein